MVVASSGSRSINVQRGRDEGVRRQESPDRCKSRVPISLFTSLSLQFAEPNRKTVDGVALSEMVCVKETTLFHTLEHELSLGNVASHSTSHNSSASLGDKSDTGDPLDP